MDIGLLLLRLVLALILFTHAAQKLTGWFGGNGLRRQGEIFASLGLHPGRGMVLAAGLSELIAGGLLLLGLLTPVGALLATATMLVAGVTLQLNSGNFWNVAGGGEYPYVLAAAAAVLGFTGAGAYSLDAALNGAAWATLVQEPAAWVGILVVLAALAGATPFALVVRRAAGAR
ncbi:MULTISPECIES: DoxX family protein [unclassified Nesterenkonia]|uniref:DoxX family protein n=1 Tax=unclassified Nesterenkonia TaxID=2629769 RepID=UPI001A911008|nr:MULTISPECIES: DoxX family protein [unclassified Nesterenkonia]